MTGAPRFVDGYIDGRWSRGAQGSRVVHDPAYGEVLAEVSVSDIDQCMSAVDAAAAALGEWFARPAIERAEVLRRVFDRMTARAEEIAELIVRENGKALADARAEVRYAAEFFRWYANGADRLKGDMRRSPAGHNWIMVTHEPAGVALLVTPWNFPAAMATRKLAPALAAGCTVVLKPAMETPLTALALAGVLEEAGVPAGVVNVVTPSPAGPAVAAMLSDNRVRALSFTGSTEVGRILLRGAAQNVVKCSMELGGNAPFIVMDDADLDDALAGLMTAKMRNGGAACTAANRVYVQRGIAGELIDRFSDAMSRLRIGPGLDAGTELGPMVTVEERRRVHALVADAVSRGASVTTGGNLPDRPGYFYQPTVLTGVEPTSALATQEIFGPVAPIFVFDHADEAVALANGTDAGLVSYVYTQSLERGLELSRRLQSGMVGLNRGVVSDPAAPFGGTKHSGLGREGADEGMYEFMETKYVAIPYR